MTRKAKVFKRILTSYTSLGLFIGALLYLICLTGTLAIFHPQFERWEQPNINEYKTLTVSGINKAFKEYQFAYPDFDSAVYLHFPSDELPRAHMSANGQKWWLNQDGSFSVFVSHPWTNTLRDLHVYLHIPETITALVISFITVVLLQLMLSDLSAHNRLIKDIFCRTFNSNEQAKQPTDNDKQYASNPPWYLLSALACIFFILTSVILYFSTLAFYQAKEEKEKEAMYLQSSVNNQKTKLQLDKAFIRYQRIAPNSSPIYIAVKGMGSSNPKIEIAAIFSSKLSYSEIYQFSANGKLIDARGSNTRAVTKQSKFVAYQRHFNDFADVAFKVVYVMLGLTLCFICTKGVNKWLRKREVVDQITYQWTGFIFAVPCALLAALLSSFLFNDYTQESFWLTLVAAQLLSATLKNTMLIKVTLKDCCIFLIVMVIVIYQVRYGQLAAEIYAILINLALLAVVFALWHSRNRNWRNYQMTKATHS
ncbi:PepSY-associated TM helix domain-containing protein [Thalassotalea marina]|uniref:Uncharacterized protein n=1 Tax=Thalassotalea marina TaxID=1673741 RepID=A0A919BNC2_9GAMM|nr:PepSY-associated TM helix domain-containing protein [Thalassotalea marina]GHG03353.1 hypothetical protein GCM10017161_35760 [Thalassotalea marina]